MDTSAFLAHSGLWNTDENVVAKVKLATLLNDAIIHSGPMPPLGFAQMTAKVHGEPSLNAQTLREISHCWSNAPSHIPKYELIPSDFEDRYNRAPATLKLAATESLLKQGFSPHDHYDDFKLRLYTVLEIEYWRKNFPESTFIGHEISDFAIQGVAAPFVEQHGLQEVLSPESGVLNLTWNDIFDLRRSPFLERFRSKHAELQQSGQLIAIKEHYQEALEKLADAVRPNPEKAFGVAVLSNLPIPIFSTLVHLAHGAHEVHHQEHLRKQFGWVMFVREARKLSTKA
jgi:hypothetical protein